MMPLWMRAISPLQSRSGWAFVSEGAPWVAQRVWPMPTVPFRCGRRDSRTAISPAALCTASPFSTTATPAES